MIRKRLDTLITTTRRRVLNTMMLLPVVNVPRTNRTSETSDTGRDALINDPKPLSIESFGIRGKTKQYVSAGNTSKGSNVVQIIGATEYSVGDLVYIRKQSEGFLTFSHNPRDKEFIVINGVNWNFVTTDPVAAANETVIQQTLEQTLVQLAADLEYSATKKIAEGEYAAGRTALLVKYNGFGLDGDSFGLNIGTAASDVSGPTLTGGMAQFTSIAAGSSGINTVLSDVAQATVTAADVTIGADEHQSLQVAMNAAAQEGRALFIPDGSNLAIGDCLRWVDGLEMYGNGSATLTMMFGQNNGTTGMIRNGKWDAKTSNWQLHDLILDGNDARGPFLTWWGDNNKFYNIRIPRWGNRSNGGKCITYAGDNNELYNFYAYTRIKFAGLGGVLCLGGKGNRVHDFDITSGDDCVGYFQTGNTKEALKELPLEDLQVWNGVAHSHDARIIVLHDNGWHQKGRKAAGIDGAHFQNIRGKAWRSHHSIALRRDLDVGKDFSNITLDQIDLTSGPYAEFAILMFNIAGVVLTDVSIRGRPKNGIGIREGESYKMSNLRIEDSPRMNAIIQDEGTTKDIVIEGGMLTCGGKNGLLLGAGKASVSAWAVRDLEIRDIGNSTTAINANNASNGSIHSVVFSAAPNSTKGNGYREGSRSHSNHITNSDFRLMNRPVVNANPTSTFSNNLGIQNKSISAQKNVHSKLPRSIYDAK